MFGFWYWESNSVSCTWQAGTYASELHPQPTAMILVLYFVTDNLGSEETMACGVHIDLHAVFCEVLRYWSDSLMIAVPEDLLLKVTIFTGMFSQENDER